MYQSNMELIRDLDEILFARLKNLKPCDNFKVVETPSGKPTLKISLAEQGLASEYYLYSRYDPLKEAADFVRSQMSKADRTTVIYGFGLGYHVEEALKLLNSCDKLYVFEMNIKLFNLALKLNDLRCILGDKRLKIFVSDDERYIAANLNSVLNEKSNFIIHLPSARAIPEENKYFKFLMESWNMKKNLIDGFSDLMASNYKENMKLGCRNVGELFGKWKDKPIIIASSGPSLNKNKHLLKDIKDRVFIFSAGSALKPLLDAGVKPDMFCIIDPQPMTYKQIEGYEDMDIPLVFLDTASAYTVSMYKGPKYIACNDESRLHNKKHLISTGGSVATAVMDMAIKFGGNPIIFVGQDLAFTNNQHHADGGMYGERAEVMPTSGMKRVEGQNGEILYSSLGLLSFKYWIENKIRDNPNIRFINASEGGALIKGCEHMRLEEVLKTV